MRTIEVIPAEGILLIGDPHLSSRRPGRRRDDDFVATVIGKLSAAMRLADAGRLLPIILGDVLDSGDDSDVRMLTLLTRVLRSCWRAPWYLVGNHTLTLGRRSTHRELSDGHALSLLAEAGTLHVLSGDGNPDLLVRTPSSDILVGGVCWGRDIPGAAGEQWAATRADIRLLATHHDLSFPGRFTPGAMPLSRVDGIDLVVNGHIHDTRLPVRVGATWFFNPGNITRMSIDLEAHVPSVFSLVPGREDAVDQRLSHVLPFGLRRHVLEHVAEIFDHTGRRIDATEPPPITERPESSFVSLLRQETEIPRTEDGSVFLEELQAVFEELEVDPRIRGMLTGLLAEQVDRPASGN
jgi:predicted phosphodiesterase